MALEALKEWDLSRDNPLAKNGYHAYARSHRISWPNPKHIFNVTRRHLSYGYLTCEKKTKHTYGRQMQAIIMWPAANHPLVPGKWDIQISCYKLVPPTLLSWLIRRLTRVYCRYVYTLMNLEPNNYSWLFIIYIYIYICYYMVISCYDPIIFWRLINQQTSLGAPSYAKHRHATWPLQSPSRFPSVAVPSWHPPDPLPPARHVSKKRRFARPF